MNKKKLYRSKFAQNRISYIVYGNPVGAKKLLYDYGYEAPENIHDLVKAVKLLVQKKGRKVIKDLIQIHPDKQIILKFNKEKEDSYCGVCHNYSYNTEDNYCGICGHTNYTGDLNVGDYVNQLLDMSTTELENQYQDILKQSNQNPDDTDLAEEAHLIWNELRKRKVSDNESKTDKSNTDQDADPIGGLLFLGTIFALGMLIGSGIKRKCND